MTFKEVLLAIDGIREKDLYNQQIVKRSTIIIASALGGKKIAQNIDKIWPIGESKGKDWLSNAKKLLQKAAEFDDKNKVKKILGDRVHNN